MPCDLFVLFYDRMTIKVICTDASVRCGKRSWGEARERRRTSSAQGGIFFRGEGCPLFHSKEGNRVAFEQLAA